MVTIWYQNFCNHDVKSGSKTSYHIVNWGCMKSWWRHQMETFSALLALCAGNSPVIGEFPSQRPVTRSFDILFDLRLNKRLSKQLWGWWFGTPSRSLWRHGNVRRKSQYEYMYIYILVIVMSKNNPWKQYMYKQFREYIRKHENYT